MTNRSTIAAIATPPGKGAIAVIRLSGPGSVPICEKIFTPRTNAGALGQSSPNTIHYGSMHDKGDLVDDVLVSLFRAPRSYTGEDVVEISCHGSVFIQQKILQLLLDNGAEPARPGEFTQRAFLNGKMDLSQAEAVADLISSESAAFHKVAMNQMRGGFSSELKALRRQLLDFISLVELELDFSEEDVEFADRDELKTLLNRISIVVGSLTRSFALGNALKNGIPVVIAGKPNAGKSTLLNRLLMEEKALVSDVPGTTRDSIEDVIHVDGIAFRFIDTAGIRETTDRVEVMGIERTMEKIRQAAVILFMAEATDTAGHINHLVDGLRSRIEGGDKTIILLLNKSDLLDNNSGFPGQGSETPAGYPDQSPQIASPAGNKRSELKKGDFHSLGEKDHVLAISAKTSSGLQELRSLLVSIANQGKSAESDIIVTNIRHYHALRKAHEALGRASEGLENGLPGDLLAMDVREVLHFLGEITGEITTDEILGNIFKNFCIGK